MQSPSSASTNSSSSSSSSPPSRSPCPCPSPPPSPKRPPSPSADDNKGKKLTKRTLRIPKKGAKSLQGLVDVPLREVIAAGRTSRMKKNVDEAKGGSHKIRLRLKRKPAEASTSPETPICLQTEHPATNEQVQDQTPDYHHQGEGNGGGDSGAEKKSEKEEEEEEEEEEGSSAATEGNNNGFDLNQPIEEVQVSAEKNEEEDTSGDETMDEGPRKKFRFDLNEFPSHEDEDENQP